MTRGAFGGASLYPPAGVDNRLRGWRRGDQVTRIEQDFQGAVRRRIIEEDFGRLHVLDKGVAVNVDGVTESIDMLLRYVDRQEIEALLVALEELKRKPDNLQCLKRVAEAFNELGFAQGQVLLYAPYINWLLSGAGAESDPSGNEK